MAIKLTDYLASQIEQSQTAITEKENAILRLQNVLRQNEETLQQELGRLDMMKKQHTSLEVHLKNALSAEVAPPPKPAKPS